MKLVVSKAARSLDVARRAEKLCDFPRVLKSCFNAYVLPNLEYYALVWMSSAESHLSLLNRVVLSVERLCEGKLCCLGHRRKINALCLLYKIKHRADHCLHKHLHHFAAACNTMTSVVLCELSYVIQRC